MALGISQSALHIGNDGTRGERSSRHSIHLFSHSLINSLALPFTKEGRSMIEEVGRFGIVGCCGSNHLAFHTYIYI